MLRLEALYSSRCWGGNYARQTLYPGKVPGTKFPGCQPACTGLQLSTIQYDSHTAPLEAVHFNHLVHVDNSALAPPCPLPTPLYTTLNAHSTFLYSKPFLVRPFKHFPSSSSPVRGEFNFASLIPFAWWKLLDPPRSQNAASCVLTQFKLFIITFSRPSRPLVNVRVTVCTKTTLCLIPSFRPCCQMVVWRCLAEWAGQTYPSVLAKSAFSPSQ